MKLFKTITLTLMLTALTSQISFANFPNPVDDPNPTVNLRNYVTKLLKKPDLEKDVNENVRISFFVTAEEKLVVLKTDARTLDLDDFIKTRLNYQKIEIKDLEVDRIFHMKVRFVTD